ncbi:uncharacterized protein LOC131613513 [Vicia villosa]|uniref:uncharacterized protein LOC131613513 n=1 Tax=Vicia villosa TaxID=3911 RepID=UPI00273AF926|nr:uncharacterized protein LOC131613513 [Vicia villosa]
MIDAICRSFLWTGQKENIRKSPIAWKTVCCPKKNGGLHLVDLQIWNTAVLIKLLWNLSKKRDSIWVKCVHAYYIKDQLLMEMSVKDSFSWIMKVILMERDKASNMVIWSSDRFRMKEAYTALHFSNNQMPWKDLMFGNIVRPRAIFQLWIACHSRLSTKSRLMKWGLLDHSTCNFCDAEKTQQHLFFECHVVKDVWRKVLNWINVKHEPLNWDRELHWLIVNCKGKSKRATMLKLEITECIYMRCGGIEMRRVLILIQKIGT